MTALQAVVLPSYVRVSIEAIHVQALPGFDKTSAERTGPLIGAGGSIHRHAAAR